MGGTVKSVRWALAGLIGAISLAQSQAVYNYFPPPGISYSETAGLALGTTTGQGSGTLNAQGLYINGVAVGTGSGSVTSVSVVSANGLSGTVATPTTSPAITLAPTFTGIAYSTGTAFQAAVAGNFPTLNQSTTGNAATATLAATATAAATTPTACASGQAAQGINASFNAIGCITPYSVVNESANTFFAGPTSGTAALPTFRAMVPADLPLSSAITWTGNNTWTGANTMSPVSGVGLAITGTSSSDALDVTNGSGQFSKVIGSSVTGSSNGLEVAAGTNSSDTAFKVLNRSGTSTMFSISGAGTVAVPDSAGGGPYQVGYLGTPFNTETTNYTLQLSDRGKSVNLTGTSGTVTIPAGIFSAGDVITVIANRESTSYTITAGSGATLYWAIGNTTSGARTLSGLGVATLICIGSNQFLLTGSGIT